MTVSLTISNHMTRHHLASLQKMNIRDQSIPSNRSRICRAYYVEEKKLQTKQVMHTVVHIQS